jgi:ABC-type amino acid transport substrate-binding protein
MDAGCSCLRKLRPLSWVLPLSALLIASQAEAGSALERIRQTGRVVIAHREASVPFSYVTPDGKPVGYAMDLCHRFVDAIALKLGVKRLGVEYVMVTSANRISTIEEGKADLECESTTNNVERRARVAFAVPHYITGARYLVRADATMRELGDFKGRRVASTAGTGPLKALRYANTDRQLGIDIVEVPDHAKGVEAVETGAVDGFVMDEVLLQGLMSTRRNPEKLAIIGRYLTVEPLAVMLAKDDHDLKRIVDDEMKRLIRSREAYLLHDKWFLQPIPPHQKTLGLQMPYLLRDFWKYPSDWVVN